MADLLPSRGLLHQDTQAVVKDFLKYDEVSQALRQQSVLALDSSKLTLLPRRCASPRGVGTWTWWILCSLRSRTSTSAVMPSRHSYAAVQFSHVHVIDRLLLQPEVDVNRAALYTDVTHSSFQVPGVTNCSTVSMPPGMLIARHAHPSKVSHCAMRCWCIGALGRCCCRCCCCYCYRALHGGQGRSLVPPHTR